MVVSAGGASGAVPSPGTQISPLSVRIGFSRTSAFGFRFMM